MQLELWGIEYFDLFLVHFPIALQYVDPKHRYPPEWFGDDGKVYLRRPLLSGFRDRRLINNRKYTYARDVESNGRTGRRGIATEHWIEVHQTMTGLIMH